MSEGWQVLLCLVALGALGFVGMIVEMLAASAAMRERDRPAKLDGE